MTLHSINGGHANTTAPVTGQTPGRVDPRAPQMPWLSIYLTVRDADESLDFYSRAFGFVPGTILRDEHGELQHAELQYQGETQVMFSPETAHGCSTASPATLGIVMPAFFYLYHEDVDALFARAKEAGAKVEMEPQDMFWGDRVASLVCPNGYRWSFATCPGETGPMPGAA